jgi:serine/threonine protein kinase
LHATGASSLIVIVGELVTGAVIAGRFHLDRRIGEGGMGVVWAATHLVTRKPVALKMLKPERAADPALRQRFIREARAVCAVQHPNIVEIHDVLETEDGSPVMVMDLLHGESLGQRLDRETRLPPTEVARLILPVVSAVGTAHASGVVHRDLKPDNIFLAEEGDDTLSVKVLDFGIAKVLATETDAAATGGLTGTGAMLGTPYYMAPEQIFGERDIDHRADIWAIGVILYECLSGRRPTQADNIGQILKIITTDGIAPLDLVAPDVPVDLARLVRRMLTRDRAARPQSLGEVQATLRRFTDAAVRSFGDPAVALPRGSFPAEEEVQGHTRVDSHDGAHALSETKLQTTGGSRISHRFGSGDVSPTAATLASTTASTTADRLMNPRPRGLKAVPTFAWIVLSAAMAAAGVFGWNATTSHAPAAAPPPSAPATLTTAVPAPATVPSVTTAADTASSAPPPAASSAAHAKAPVPRAGAPAHATSPAVTTTAPAVIPPAPTTAATTPPGGVVEKPPF